MNAKSDKNRAKFMINSNHFKSLGIHEWLLDKFMNVQNALMWVHNENDQVPEWQVFWIVTRPGRTIEIIDQAYYGSFVSI